uniref:Coronin n=1 Tax=Caenorhabditis tropicalis TaxID=1561998 RepID=A0A1I7TMK3_9PELO
MAQIVRQSKFRHVFCKPVKHESCMSDIRVTEITWDSLFCDVNPKFIAFINRGAGGPFMVIPVNKIGRIDKDYPFVDAHKAPCLEVAWSPFNDNVIASCSEDTTCKVWVIPDRGLSRNLSEPAVELTGHQKRVNTIAWHPVANNVLLTAGGENVMFMWNVGTGEALLEISGHPDQIWSINFNYDGSQFVTTCKDKKIRILDSHTGEVLHEGTGHEGVKPQRAIFVKDGLVLTTGFTKRSERLYALRAPEDLSTPIVEEELDTSNGVLFPFYDEDSGLVYLVGKGDCAIRYYEVNNEAPFVHYINTYTTNEPQRAIGFQSKRGMSSEENEINRIYKLTTKGVVDILQFFVPRKSDLFQHDLYPDTRSTIPALTAEEFMEGKNTAPNRQPVNAAAAKPKVQVAKKANILSTLAPTAAETVPTQSYAERPPSSQQPSPRPSASPRPRPVVDEDMGIVPMREAPPSRPASSRASRTEIPPKEEKGPDPMKPKQAHVPQNMDELLDDLMKMKAVLRQHERRIRMLEEEIADRNMSNAYSF